MESLIGQEEDLARIVLAPRDIDPQTGYPKDSFISLRADERGISFLRLQWMGKEAFIDRGFCRAEHYNRNQKKKQYEFAGWMEATVKDIQSLAPKIIKLVIDDPELAPEHVCIEFHKNDDVVKGIVTDAEVQDIMDDLFHLLKYVQL